MSIIPAGYAQVNFKLGGAALPRGAEVVLGVLPTTGMLAVDVATAARDAWVATLRGYTASSVVLESVLAKLGPNSTGAFVEIPVGVACSGSGQVDPPQIAFNVKKTTGHGGRVGVGRMYLPCPSEGSVLDGGIVESSALTAIQGLLSAFGTDLASGGLVPVVLHAGVTFPPFAVTSFNLEPRVATQKRRNRIRL